MATQHPATNGQTVIYHGSMTQVHGPATFRGVCQDCDECDALFDLWEFHGARGDAPIRYVLALYGGVHELRCVRAESFTAVVVDTIAVAQ